MSKTLEQVKADALSLTESDQNQLINELTESRIDHVIDTDRNHIEDTLAERIKGPFVTPQNPNKYFKTMRRRFAKRTALKRAHG